LSAFGDDEKGITVPEKKNCTLRKFHSPDRAESLRGIGSENAL